LGDAFRMSLAPRVAISLPNIGGSGRNIAFEIK
jgi:hypothetical protein